MTTNRVYWIDWSNQAEMLADFGITEAALSGATVLLAGYAGGYEGVAYVLFEQGGQLYVVYGSHCSCYGLEDQWSPELVVPSADIQFDHKHLGAEFGERAVKIIKLYDRPPAVRTTWGLAPGDVAQPLETLRSRLNTKAFWLDQDEIIEHVSAWLDDLARECGDNLPTAALIFLTVKERLARGTA